MELVRVESSEENDKLYKYAQESSMYLEIVILL